MEKCWHSVDEIKAFFLLWVPHVDCMRWRWSMEIFYVFVLLTFLKKFLEYGHFLKIIVFYCNLAIWFYLHTPDLWNPNFKDFKNAQLYSHLHKPATIRNLLCLYHRLYYNNHFVAIPHDNNHIDQEIQVPKRIRASIAEFDTRVGLRGVLGRWWNSPADHLLQQYG